VGVVGMVGATSMASVAGTAVASSIGMGKLHWEWWAGEGSWHHCQGGLTTIGYDMSGHHTLSRLTRPEPKLGPHLHHRSPQTPSHFELGRRARVFLTLVKTGPIWTIAVRLRRAPRDAFKLRKDRADRAKRHESNFLWETAQQHPKPAYIVVGGIVSV
jgi:hypothetical protein